MRIQCDNCGCVFEEGEEGYTDERWSICPDCNNAVNPTNLVDEADDADDASEDED